MKNSVPTITLLGNNSGRNLGDAAILSAIMDSISKELPDAKFYVPSIAPKWIMRHYGERYNVQALDAMPWTGSIRLLGIPTLWAIARSDAALICDGIIFGKKFFNPAFNFLITLFFLAPWAKLVGCKLICHNCGIGPFPEFGSKWAAKVVMNLSDRISLRERESEAVAKALGVSKPIVVSGDAAFLNPVSSPQRAKEILNEEGCGIETPKMGINITSYMDTWLNQGERVSGKEAFLELLATGIDSARKELAEPFEPIVFCTQPMDEDLCRAFAQRISARVISNTKYLSHDIQAVMRECGLLMGMRFHSLVLASAVNVPVIGLIYAPKVRGYLQFMNCKEYGLELAQITSEGLRETLKRAWQERAQLWERQKPYVDQQRANA
ncbi:MAG: polysaccharide pyruvyl transferase family protein, partial [Bdellovibrionales bacterium]|nr:polysaccharide pyruvyl transferase family protein [Bdellovibrionales bacterium]